MDKGAAKAEKGYPGPTRGESGQTVHMYAMSSSSIRIKITLKWGVVRVT